MATTFETPSPSERDLRSTHKEWKRTKDSAAKWSKGVRSAAGSKADHAARPYTGSGSQAVKVRPGKPPAPTPRRAEHNVVKSRGTWGMPFGRVHNKVHALAEASDATSRSLGDLMSRPVSPTSSGQGEIFYSFDCAESPGRPLMLEIFVKTGRETERFIEREYEVIDGHGEPLQGRKARRNLRRAATIELDLAPKTVQDELEEDGFELV